VTSASTPARLSAASATRATAATWGSRPCTTTPRPSRSGSTSTPRSRPITRGPEMPRGGPSVSSTRDLTEANLTDTVVAKIATQADARFRQVAASLIRHLHAFVRDVELTEAEWLAGIQFLTATGHKCD